MKLKITVEDKVYEVEVEVLEDEPAESAPAPVAKKAAASRTAAPAAAPAASAAPAVSGDESKLIRSPILGVVVNLPVSPGQAVNAGDPVVILEAMKMESRVAAPAGGTIKAVHVKQGDGVKKGQVLAEFE